MKVEIEELEPCKKSIKVEIPQERVDEAFSQIYQQLKREVRIPGFRPGRAPVSIVRARFGDYAKAQVMENLLKEAYDKIVSEHELSPYGEPEVKDVDFDEGKPFRFTIVMEVNPDFELEDYTQIEVERRKFLITDEFVENFLNNLRRDLATLEEKDGPAEMGDVVVLDYEAIVEGVEPTKVEGAVVNLGAGETIKGFDENVVGKKAGDEFEVELTYPEDYFDKEVAGKKVLFKCRLKKVQRKVIPELDDEFAKRFNVDSVEALREKVRAELEQKFEDLSKRIAMSQLAERLVQQYDFPVPPSFVDKLVEEKLNRYEMDLRLKGVKPEKEELEEKREEFREEAVKEIRLLYVLKKIAKEEGIEVTRGDVEAQLEGLSNRFNIPVENLVEMMRSTGRLTGMIEELLQTKVLEHLLGKVKVKEVEIDAMEYEKEKTQEGADASDSHSG